jgi:general secretion pathway protein F
MPRFYYRAVSSDGSLIDGSTDAASRDDVFAELRRAGHLPIVADEARGAHRWTSLLSAGLARRKPIKSSAVTLLTSELATLLGAGMPVDTSLRMLARVTDNPALRETVERLHRDVQQGQGLAQAFANQTGVFNSFFVAVVRAGDATGDMPGALRRLARSLESRDELRASVVASLTYPLLLTAVAILSVIFLLLVVVPQFVPLFADVSGVLPASTRLLFWTSDVMRSQWVLLLVLCAIAAASGWAYVRSPENRRSLAKTAMRLPLVNELIRSFETAQFARTAETLLNGGVPLLSAVRLSAGVVANPLIRDELTTCINGIRDGTSLKRLLEATREIPRLAVELICVGEQTGRLPEMLAKTADIYDAQVRGDLKRLLTLLEPALILGLGAVVGGIIAAILTALLALTDVVAG